MGSLDLVYFSCVEWGYTRQRPQQLASRLARHGRLLYVDPLGLRSVRVADLPRIASRLARRRAPPAPAPSLDVSYPPLAYLPFPRSAFASRVNGRLLRRAVTRWLRRAGIDAPVVWVGTPSEAVLEAIGGLRPQLLVYDCLDRFALFHQDGETIARTEEAIASKADVVLATSQDLRARMRSLNPRTFLVPNAADYAHFSQAAGALPAPAATAALPRPILGYVGEIADWFDCDAVHHLAARHPRWSVVLIGPVHTPAASELLALPNVHALGRQRYEDLPGFLSRFDVCLLPFKVNALTAATSPVKLYEYLASGKPVVSTPLTEVLPYRGIVRIAEASDLPAAVEASLETADDAQARERRMAIARDNTWEHRVEQILRILEGAAGRRGATVQL